MTLFLFQMYDYWMLYQIVVYVTPIFMPKFTTKLASLIIMPKITTKLFSLKLCLNHDQIIFSENMREISSAVEYSEKKLMVNDAHKKYLFI